LPPAHPPRRAAARRQGRATSTSAVAATHPTRRSRFGPNSEPIVGQRVSFTKRAQKIIADVERLEPLAIAA